MMVVMLKALNDYVGALLLTATIALVTFSVVGYAKLETLDVRVSALERVTEQQIAINSSVNKLSETVAVLADRGERK
jgi:hypothetical protein